MTDRDQTTKQPLSELKVVVKQDMPSDELWVHPSMFDRLRRGLLEADTWRRIENLADMPEEQENVLAYEGDNTVGQTTAAVTTKLPQTPTEKKLLKILLWVWYQYGQSDLDDGIISLEHRNMSAGEDATFLLAEYGFVIDQGYSAQITPKGKSFMQEEDDT